MFDIDLLLCQVRVGETTYGDISSNRGKYRNIKELGQYISENTYMIKAYLYGKHQKTDNNNGNIRRFLVLNIKNHQIMLKIVMKIKIIINNINLEQQIK